MDHRPVILEHALPLVPFDGWSKHTLAQAGERAGVSREELRRAFPRGANDLIDYFFAAEDDALASAHPKSALAELKVPERIETLILARLMRFAPHKEAVRRAVAWRALPWNVPAACSSLYRTVDLMWRLSGDASTDFSFYTKRATLAGLTSSALIYWLNDESQDFENTKQFLKRRLRDIAAFGKKKMELKKRMKVA